jgi:hypothetical protein
MTKHRDPGAWKREDYRGAHRKGEITWGGIRFLMVKEKVDSKPHPRYYALLTTDYQPVAVGSQNNSGRGDPGPQTVDDWLKLFAECFPDTADGRAFLRARLEEIAA